MNHPSRVYRCGSGFRRWCRYERDSMSNQERVLEVVQKAERLEANNSVVLAARYAGYALGIAPHLSLESSVESDVVARCNAVVDKCDVHSGWGAQ